MEALAKELLFQINDICIRRHYLKQTDTVERGIGLSGQIRQFTSALLEGNVFCLEETEQAGFQNYVLQVLEDYVEASVQRDMVLMADVLDYGLRELLNIFGGEGTKEGPDGKGNF